MGDDTFKPVGLNKERLVGLMQEFELDGVFFSTPENVFYTTGYPALPSSGNPIIYALRNKLPYFSFADKSGNIALICWGPAAMGVEYGTEDMRPVFMPEMLNDELTNLIKEKIAPGVRIGVDSTFPFFALRLLQEHAVSVVVIDADEMINRLRLIKTNAEIERIRQSTRIIDQTLLELASILRLGMTRLELIKEAKYRLIKNGADGIDHITAAFGGANPEVALGEELQKDQIVTLDLGCVYQGYVSDNRRLVYTGKTPDTLKATHQKLCGIVAGVGDSLKPGRTFAETHAKALELFTAAGVDPLFLHVGHSMGLQVEERWITAEDQTVIQPGMVLNIELYTPSDEGVMIGDEETFVINGDGAEKISALPVEMIELLL